MKTKRFVSTLLALLLVCSLPVTAFADTVADNPEDNTTNIGEGDTMTTNNGTVETNNGTVTNNGTATDHDFAVVGTNNGEVTNNYGTVTTNGTLPESETEDLDPNAIVYYNYGTVTTNNGVVKANGTENNHDNAVVGTNNGYVEANKGTITANENNVSSNYGAVNTNNGHVGNNKLTVSTNNGFVDHNTGTVKINSIFGRVNNTEDGKVTTNYGTVREADFISFHYGVQVEGEDNSDPVQKTKGVALDLAALFTKAGYVLTGYSYAYTMGEDGVEEASSPTTVAGTSYTADCPNVLTLIWQAIVNPGSGSGSGSGSGENASAAGETAADDGTGSFGPGSFVSINGNKFLLVAVVEDVYCLASVDSFGEEQLSDLPALLSSLLTEEQLSHVTGEPELLDEELTARFFAGEGSHIVFPCDKGLIFS